VAPLWVAYEANLGTLLRTCDAVGACMAVPRPRTTGAPSSVVTPLGAADLTSTGRGRVTTAGSSRCEAQDGASSRSSSPRTPRRSIASNLPGRRPWFSSATSDRASRRSGSTPQTSASRFPWSELAPASTSPSVEASFFTASPALHDRTDQHANHTSALPAGRAYPAIARITAEMEPQTPMSPPNDADGRSRGTTPPTAIRRSRLLRGNNPQVGRRPPLSTRGAGDRPGSRPPRSGDREDHRRDGTPDTHVPSERRRRAVPRNRPTHCYPAIATPPRKQSTGRQASAPFHAPSGAIAAAAGRCCPAFSAA
jgi:hypothetical protein